MSVERLTAALADRYRLVRELGAGGMATVYLAEDLKHKRHVALKVLKPELAAVIGAERFLSEITTTANLQHPHILPLHDSGTVDGTVFYVMPFVEGESLRDRLDREKQLPISDAVRIAREVAGALDYAHRQGVIHRDIKPENVLLHDGRAVVADFGIALAASRTEGGNRMTETGMSLGTPHYMSPEQAMGERDLDGRADVYALGCVLYEMLAGEPPFTGPSAQAIVAKVMGTDPEPLTTLRRTVPAHVEHATLTALEKVPADRFATAAAFAAALEGPGGTAAGRTRATRGSRVPPGRRRAIWPAFAAALALVGLWGWLRPPPATGNLPPTRLALLLPDLGGEATAQLRQIALTPDGTTLLYASVGGSITMRIRLDGTPARVVDGMLPLQANYVVAPNGREFVAEHAATRSLYRHPVMGGTPRPLPRGVPPGIRGAAWAEDGSIWLSDNSRGITRVSAADSVSHPLGGVERDVVINQVLPGDRAALAVRRASGANTGSAVLLDLRTGESTPLIDGAMVHLWYAVGHLVYVTGDAVVWAVPFDPAQGEVTGSPVELGRGVALTGTGIAQLSVAANGTVAYMEDVGRSLVLVGRDGSSRPLLEALGNFHHPRFSPDGQRLAVDFNSEDGRDVWVVNLADGAMSRATFDRDGHDGSWAPDGRSLVYLSLRGGNLGVHRTRVGSAAPAESLLTSPQVGYSGIFRRDGASLVTVAINLLPESSDDIAMFRTGGRGSLEPLVASRFDESYPALSPDERWLAYTSTVSGREEVYLRSMEGDDEPITVSLGGGRESVWDPTGRVLYYRSGTTGSALGTRLVAATINTSPRLAVTERATLFPMDGFVTTTPHANYDIAPDGRSFAFVRSNPSTRVMVIQNLPAMVERLREGAQGIR